MKPIRVPAEGGFVFGRDCLFCLSVRQQEMEMGDFAINIQIFCDTKKHACCEFSPYSCKHTHTNIRENKILLGNYFVYVGGFIVLFTFSLLPLMQIRPLESHYI